MDMVKERKIGWTCITIPIHIKKRLEGYALPRETWEETFLRLIQEIEDYKLMRERFKFK